MRRQGLPAALEPVVLRDEPLWTRTSIRTGGPARVWCRPHDVDQLRKALDWARALDVPYVVLGGGTNVIFPDSGYDGLVLDTAGLRGRTCEGTSVWAAAGERLADVAWWATTSGLAGLEWACGIPGSVGGAVVMNAGAEGDDIAGVLEHAEVLTHRGALSVPVGELDLAYRTSALLAGGLPGVVAAASFALRRDEPAACLRRARAAIDERIRRLPVGASAGCVFRNPPGAPAGWLLERAGCKGLRAGRAWVSDRHANVIVNEGTNNAGDVLGLLDEMKRRVRERFDVELEEEVVRLDRASVAQ